MRRNNAFQRHQVSHISQDDCEHEDILFEAHMPWHCVVYLVWCSQYSMFIQFGLIAIRELEAKGHIRYLLDTSV